MSEAASKHEYADEFFAYINAGSLASARVICPFVVEALSPATLLDVGCGAGAWCKVWASAGVPEVLGVDGDYVETKTLLIPEETFHRHDLARGFDLGRQFDLVTSFEVAEHLSENAAEGFVDTLTRHGKRVFFSAAVPGQGGEFHVNEQPLDYWRQKFAARGYECFKLLPDAMRRDRRVEPWYRYNMLLYVHESVVDELPPSVRGGKVLPGSPIPEFAPATWRLRNRVIAALPDPVVKRLVQAKHAVTRALRRGAAP